MWILNNRTPYAAERTWTRDKHGTHVWLVAVKATFDISPDGRLSLSDEQAPPVLVPEYRGDPATTSLRLDSDLLAPKPGTDVVAEASAYAPHGRPVASIPVTLSVGEIDKTLIVYGPRSYYRATSGLMVSSPRPFIQQLIDYESAFGGSDTKDPDPRRRRVDLRNPVGKGVAVNPRTLEGSPAHTVEYPHGNASGEGPAGFGPIASFWSPRVERAGTYDDHWEQTRKPLLAADYDERFALCSPDDQRPAHQLRGGEAVRAINLTPQGLLKFDLPRIYLAFSTYIAKRIEEHRAILATVFLSLEQLQVSLVWQSALRVRSRDVDYLDHTSIDEKTYIR